MKTTKKLLVTFFVTVTLMIFYSSTAYASELDALENQSVQETAIEDTVINSSSEVQSNDTQAGNGTNEDQDLADGNYIDEQGQIHSEAPDESSETAAEDTIEEPKTSDKDTSNSSSKDSGKTSGKASESNSKDKTEIKKPSYSEKDLRLLSSLIYSEAGNQSYNGMLAVANVVLNRAKSDVFWHTDTIEEVIYDHKWSVQFSVTIKNKKTGISPLDRAFKYYDTRKFTGSNPEAEKKSMNRAIKAAKAALEGKNNIGGYLCFTNKRDASSIKRNYSDYKIIGDHIFYRKK